MIVGAGTAGAIIAARLAQAGRDVVLLEAGPDFPTADATPDVVRYGSYSEGRLTTRDFSWHWATALTEAGGEPYILYSGRITGGGSSVNGQVWLHGLPGDFNGAWSTAAGADWNWNAVEPWYRRTERDLDYPTAGESGEIPVRRIPEAAWHPLHAAFVQACRDSGFALCADFNAVGAEGVGAQPFNNVDGVRVSSALSHLSLVRELPNLRILGGHTVERILFQGTRAAGVLAKTSDGDVTVGAREVILAAGAIGTPWLLMRSGVGPTEQLDRFDVPIVADAPGVGTGLREHPQFALRWRSQSERPLDLTSARSPVALRMTAPGSSVRDDIKISISAFHDDAGFGVQVAIFLMLALSRGDVTLSEDGPDSRPVIDFQYLEHPEDRRRLRETVRFAVRLVENSGLSSFVAERDDLSDDVLFDDDQLDGWLRRRVQGTYHPSSTCAMGDVIDADARVRGVDNLRVVDAAAMPESVRANLNATVSMMGERFAAMISAEAAD
ncbi:GMC family oxidoreductase [Subtercola sp. YIM 133946]|uniref:GMC family oxidoreductase n=1 Tax=Subtercola sp. YIM 133946 TaxID=3118909 RepID=UPI002F95F7D5